MNRAVAHARGFALAALGLLVVDGWLGWVCWNQWDQARLADAQFVHLAGLADQIERLRRNPLQIEEGARSHEALARLVETAARQVNLSPEQIVQIDPSEPRRLEKTPYLEQRTSLELREVRLQQIVEFAMALEASGQGLDVPTLALRIPAAGDSPANEERWNAQLLLTCRIYDGSLPPSPSVPAP